MTEWETDARRGLVVGTSLIVTIILVDVGLIWLAATRPLSIETFVIGLAVLVSLGLMGLVGYWLYGLARSGYFLDRNALVIRWGPTEQTVPTGRIERVLKGAEIEGRIRFHGGMWPGHCVGYGEVPGVGPALFYATVPPRHQIYIVTPGLTYGISPANREGFLESLRTRLEMGPTQIVEQSSRRLTFLNWPIIFVLPLIGLLALLFNGVLGWLAYRHERMASYLLWGGGGNRDFGTFVGESLPGSLDFFELLGGFVLSLVIGVIGYKRGALNGSGVVGAALIGTLIFGLGGWEWGILLIAFFVSSSALSFYRAREKQRLAEKFAKGHRRDLGQALANGGVAALLAVLSHFLSPFPGEGRGGLWFVACGLITTGRRVEVGASGGVTWLGTVASLGGALFIGLLGALVLRQGWAAGGILLLAATVGGLAGSVCDSILGATVQGIYWCDTCQKETERRVHRCGTETRLLRGWRWLGNDAVNFTASAVGALTALGVGWLLLWGS